MLTIQTTNLVRRFKNFTAVDRVNLQVPNQSVYGFLGPNGAGKTTTIRMLLDLIKPTEGEVRLFDESLHTNRQKLLQRVGSLVEVPSLYSHLTGYENLEVFRRLLDLKPTQIDRALGIVRLQQDAKRLVKEYSLGMKQRLGLALALLSEPQLLILDEPTNGLDPAGILEMRNLIRSFPSEFGITVFLSSHLLSEVEQIATHIGIINKGKLLFQGAIEELQNQRQERVAIEVDKPTDAGSLLEKKGWQVHHSENGRLYVSAKTKSEVSVLNTLLVNNSINVFHLNLEQSSLEDIFLHLTSEK